MSTAPGWLSEGEMDRRIWRNVEKTEGCWIWRGPMTTNGYGRISVRGKGVQVHRITYALKHGPIPAGLVVDHICRVRACVNPDHLRAITNAENVLIGEGLTAQHARKTHCPKGHPYSPENLVNVKRGRTCKTCHNERQREWHRKTGGRSTGQAQLGGANSPRARLNQPMVAEIIARLHEGQRTTEIAKALNLSRYTVSHVKLGKRYVAEIALARAAMRENQRD